MLFRSRSLLFIQRSLMQSATFRQRSRCFIYIQLTSPSHLSVISVLEDSELFSDAFHAEALAVVVNTGCRFDSVNRNHREMVVGKIPRSFRSLLWFLCPWLMRRRRRRRGSFQGNGMGIRKRSVIVVHPCCLARGIFLVLRNKNSIIVRVT